VIDFFISYRSTELKWTERIAQHLRDAGWSVIYQDADFRAGKPINTEIDAALENARCTIAVLEPEYFKSNWCKYEWDISLSMQNNDAGHLLLPVRVKDEPLPKVVAASVWVDCVNASEEQVRERLIDAAMRLLNDGKPASQPPGAMPSALRRHANAEPSARHPIAAGTSIFRVQRKHNRHFVGRDQLLAKLRQALITGQHAALTQAITGLGGVGKTQLAAEYAYNHRKDYEIVWWVPAEDPVAAISGLAELADDLGLPEKVEPDLDRKKDAVLRWLSDRERWLLIFDNAKEPRDLAPCLPDSPGGHVIVTSRNPNWGEVAEPLPVHSLEQPDATQYLLERTHKKEPDAAKRLARELGGLPLALAQAAAYIEASAKSIADYLELFLNCRERLWKRERAPEDWGKDKPEHEQNLVTTISINLDAIEQATPAAVGLMNLVAFLDPDQIPLDMLIAGAKYIPNKLAAALSNPVDFDEAIAALRSYSLVDVSGRSLSVHRVVQQIVHDRLARRVVARNHQSSDPAPDPSPQPLSPAAGERGRGEGSVVASNHPTSPTRSYAAAAVKIVNDAMPEDSLTNLASWPIIKELLPHAKESATHAERLGIEPAATGRLLNEVGLYLRIRAEFVEARNVLERAVRIGEQAFGPDHPNVASIVNNLGGVLRALGDLAGARQAFERALKFDEQAFGPDHPKVAIRVNNLGSVLRDLGDLPGARRAYERALKIDEQAFGPDHPNVASIVNNLGLVLLDLGDLPGARRAFKRALKIDEQAFGPDHPNVARDVNNLGRVLQDLGDLPGARQAIERALKIDEQAFGPDHPEVATDVNNLGRVLQDLGDLPGARRAFERALKIDEQAFGPDHPNVAIRVNNLGGVLHELGDLSGARQAWERSLEIDEKVFGPDHPKLAIRLKKLGRVRRFLGDLPGSKQAYERALGIFRKSFGDDHENTKRVRGNLAAVNKLIGAGGRAVE